MNDSTASVSALSKRLDNFICVSNESGLVHGGWFSGGKLRGVSTEKDKEAVWTKVAMI